ncbi:MAG: hypothetical protein M3P06_19610 [Acidobacteriota bacterium]|nr:hypothetical protein [Acidobacteriota bacterium]
MTYDEFVFAMTDAHQQAQRRLSEARGHQYWSIPQDQLLALYQKYSNANFTTLRPSAQTAMIVGFVESAARNRMGEIYEGALNEPWAWPEVVARCRRELNDMAAQVLDDMDAALGRS